MRTSKKYLPGLFSMDVGDHKKTTSKKNIPKKTKTPVALKQSTQKKTDVLELPTQKKTDVLELPTQKKTDAIKNNKPAQGVKHLFNKKSAQGLEQLLK